MSPGIEWIPAKMPFCWAGTCGGTRGEDVELFRLPAPLLPEGGAVASSR